MSYLDEALAEVKRVTPKSGVNVCIYDDYEDVGNKLETIANFNTVEEAQKFINDYDGDAELVMYEAEILEESAGKNFMSSDKNHNIPTYLEMSLQDYISNQNRDNDDYEDTNWKKSNEFDEDNVNRHPEGAEDGKGGQFAPKDGGVGHSFSEPKEINKEELDEDSDYRKDNPVKKDNVIHTGDPIGEEWYEKLEIGEEYLHLDQARPALIRGLSEYTQDVKGYNLTNVFERKIKSQYSDDRDKLVGTVTKCYNDDGKLIAEQVRNDYSGVFIVSEKRLDESGEMKEIEYTDEEHQKNMRNFVPKYGDDYRGGMREKWDKNQEKRKKSKGFDVKDGGRKYIKRDPDIKKLEDERAEILNKYHETNGKINKLDKTKDADEIRELQSEGDELMKESGRIHKEIFRVEHSPEKDDTIEQPLKECSDVMSQIFRIWSQEQDREHGYQNYDSGVFNTLSRDELSKYTSKLDEEKKQIFEKFFRNSDKIREGISSGEIKSIGGKFIEDGGKLDEHSLLAFSNNQISINNALYMAEVKSAEYGVDLTSATLLHYRNEVTNKDGYYEGDYSDDMVYVGSNIEEHYKVDEEKHKELIMDFDKAYSSGSSRKMEQAQKALKDFDDSKPKISDRERKLLDDVNKYKNMNKKSYGYKKEKVQMYKDRIGNEVFTPLTEKNVHLYADNGVDEETLKHMYSKAKKFFPMNKWVKSSLDVLPDTAKSWGKGRTRNSDIPAGRWGKSYPTGDHAEKKMNLQLNSGDGKKFKVSGSSKMSQEAGNWDKEHQTINVFKANPESIDWIWEHELSHSHYDYLQDSVGMNLIKNKIKAFNTFNEECKKLDPDLITQLMGSYAGEYIKAFQNDEPYGQNLETEMYAGLTDLRYEKAGGKGMSISSWKAYRELAKTYPDFIKTFEILSDKPIGDDYVEPVFDEDERKSFGESLVINDFEVETWEEVGLDDSRNKVDFSDATLIMNKGYNKIGKLVLVETYLPENVKAEEEFVEEEHPRDEDGKFTSKWEISTFVGGHEIPVTQREKDNWEKHTTEEQRKDPNFKTMYGDKLKEKAKGKGWDESEDVKVEKEIVEPQPPEERPQGDNYRIKAMKNKLKKHLEILEDGKQILKDKYGDSPNLESALQKMDIAIKQLKKEIDDVDTKKYRTELPNIPMGKNTHTNETDGFVYNKTKIKIDRKLEENMGLRQQLAVIQSAWNDLPDDVRDVVKILNLKMSRARGRTIQGGMYNDKKQEVVLNINERSTNTVHNFYHEIGHARWHDMERKQPEKIKKFEEQVRKINKAPTKYAESYKNAVDRENKFRERWTQKIKRSGQVELDPERYAKNMKILDARANAVKNIFENEIHSELNAYAMGEIEDEMIIVGKDTLKSLLNAYKDLWGIEN